MVGFLILAAVSGAAAHPAGRRVMENGVYTVPSTTWSRGDRCDGDSPVTLHVNLAMSPEAREVLEAKFWAVSDPKHVDYGKHLKVKEIAAIVGATPKAIATVKAFFQSYNANQIEVAATRDLIRVSLPCGEAERAFSTVIHRWRHSKGVELLRASTEHSLPVNIASLVSLVGDLTGLPDPRGPVVTPISEPNTNGIGGFPEQDRCSNKCGIGGDFVTPSVLASAYNLGDSPKTAKGSMGVAEFQGVMWDEPALNKFSTACQLSPAVNVTHQIGPNKPTKCEIPVIGLQACAEAMLDIEYIGAIGGAIPLTDIESQKYSLFDWAQQVLDLPHEEIPLVMSVSYGNDEAQQTSKDYMLQTNVQFQKMGVAGISVLFAAGDQGVLGREGSIGSKVYHPDFPASSPFITAVGGTDFVTKGQVGPEMVWTLGGGGFSNTFGIPSYQAEAVATYLKTAGSNLPPSSKWNASGRAYPDVSALGGQGNPYCVIVGNSFTGVAGTSASCPVVAGTIAKLNEIRLASGKSPLGFLNPWIYQTASAAFNDVTEGRNCGGPKCNGNEGFPAVTGWDAATGWGTPNFEKLKELV